MKRILTILMIILASSLVSAVRYMPTSVLLTNLGNVTNTSAVYINGTSIFDLFLMLNTSNDPLTGNLEINKDDPQLSFEDGGFNTIKMRCSSNCQNFAFDGGLGGGTTIMTLGGTSFFGLVMGSSSSGIQLPNTLNQILFGSPTTPMEVIRFNTHTGVDPHDDELIIEADLLKIDTRDTLSLISNSTEITGNTTISEYLWVSADIETDSNLLVNNGDICLADSCIDEWDDLNYLLENYMQNDTKGNYHIIPNNITLPADGKRIIHLESDKTFPYTQSAEFVNFGSFGTQYNTTLREGSIIQESTGYYFRATGFGYPWNRALMNPGGMQFFSGNHIPSGSYQDAGLTFNSNYTGSYESYYLQATEDRTLEFLNGFGGKRTLQINETYDIRVYNKFIVDEDADIYGNLTVRGNITMYSPNGTYWNCGVSNTGVWGCSN